MSYASFAVVSSILITTEQTITKHSFAQHDFVKRSEASELSYLPQSRRCSKRSSLHVSTSSLDEVEACDVSLLVKHGGKFFPVRCVRALNFLKYQKKEEKKKRKQRSRWLCIFSNFLFDKYDKLFSSLLFSIEITSFLTIDRV